jgi:serine/threonine protein kinase
MPPAMGVLMEFCEHGSLYNFLYKRIRQSFSVKDTINEMTNRISTLRRSSTGRGRVPASPGNGATQALNGDENSSASPLSSKRKSARKSFLSRVRSATRDNLSMSSRIDDDMSFAISNQQFMADAIRGVAFLHEYGYMHCDIKSLNYLVDSVSDFAFFSSIPSLLLFFIHVIMPYAYIL